MLSGYYEVQPRRKSNKKLLLATIVGLAVIGTVAGVALLAPTRASPLALSQLDTEREEFSNFVKIFNKEYASPAEYEVRFQIYRDNAAFIRVFNSHGRNWSLGLNQFADLTFEEFKSIYHPNKFEPTTPYKAPYEVKDIPSKVDWRLKGIVTPVKNQGMCGSCWSFSATGAMESAWALAGNPLTQLSEQQLVDCSRAYGNMGCNGGWMNQAFEYVMDHAITSERNYPYTGKDGQCNQTKVNQPVAWMNHYVNVTADDPDALKQAIALQPVSVAVEADGIAWQFYFGGIIDGLCGDSLDHGVLAVGYDLTGSKPFYWVKNSWGSGWGLDGYIKLGIKNGVGVCGIQKRAAYPIALTS